ncbi:hypothetical protein BCR44DRAFT_1427551 [Catenaria anguillulae PL171]|uniref:Uncharacterized protein n=1 Tax=Catenaria anguillulae PL171 TaxID=765915 RepID=A0A1Y2HXE1_9FUNG|nr:hypothetical protein BCR44DRAFT_1427551 [Catenaria anguillulae PL171]
MTADLSNTTAAVTVTPGQKAQCITVINKTPFTIFISISAQSGGSDKWFPVCSEGHETWTRTPGSFETVAARDQYGRQVGELVPVGSLVRVHNFDHPFVAKKSFSVAGTTEFDEIDVLNASNESVEVMISSRSNPSGSEDWYMLGPGHADKWKRHGFEIVVVRSLSQATKVGVYVSCGSAVTFNRFV